MIVPFIRIGFDLADENLVVEDVTDGGKVPMELLNRVVELVAQAVEEMANGLGTDL